MKIYVVMWKDRHTDTDAFLFSKLDEAIAFAKDSAETYCHPEDEVDYDCPGGWLFCAEYSCEGDKLWIVEKEVK